MEKLEKEIVLKCNPVVNLLLHVICCFDKTFPRKPVYEGKASEWISPEELRFFEENFKMEQTGKVSSTAHFAFLFQIPAYFSTDKIESLTEVLNLMTDGKLAALKRAYPEKAKMVDSYMPLKFQKNFFDTPLEERKNRFDVTNTYRDILLSVYERFYRGEWRETRKNMMKTADFLKAMYFDKHDLIEAWEEKTGLNLPYPRFVVELADPISSLGTSLMAERDSFSHWVSPEKIFTLVSHEIGTHIFIQTETMNKNSFGAILEKNPEQMFRLQEALAYMTNMAICNSRGTVPAYSEKFQIAFAQELAALNKIWQDIEEHRISYIDGLCRAFKSLYPEKSR